MYIIIRRFVIITVRRPVIFLFLIGIENNFVLLLSTINYYMKDLPRFYFGGGADNLFRGGLTGVLHKFGMLMSGVDFRLSQ